MNCIICNGTGIIQYTWIKPPMKKPVDKTSSCFRCLGSGRKLNDRLESQIRYQNYLSSGLLEAFKASGGERNL